MEQTAGQALRSGAALQPAGLPRGSIRTAAAKPRGPGLPPFKWKQNGLRHSYASYRLAITNDAAQAPLEMGNSPQKLFKNCRKVVTRSQAIAWFSVMPEAAGNIVPIQWAAS